MNRICIIANSIIEPGMSGGNRIFIECAKRWVENGQANVEVFTSDVGEKLCRDNGLGDVKYVVWRSSYFARPNPIFLYALGTLLGSVLLLRGIRESDCSVVYSSSDFWPDAIPGALAKLRRKRMRWVASFYLAAPNPFSKTSPYRGWKLLRGFLYWSSQAPVLSMIRGLADAVFVTHEPDRKLFVGRDLESSRVFAVRGGVDSHSSDQVPDSKVKDYDAVFVGRFHSQKGVLELPDIWKHVCDLRGDSRLAIIGVGDLEKEIKNRIQELGIQDAVDFLGFKDGVEKIEIIKRSKIGLYPATVDHWSMAPVEIMSCGLPLVTFNVPTLKYLNPRGMVLVPCYDFGEFANAIVNLLRDENLQSSLGSDAKSWARTWDWDERAGEVLEHMLAVNSEPGRKNNG